MEIHTHSFAELSDEALTETVKRLARNERYATAQLVASLAVFDERRLYLGAGCASLFAYCTRVLRLSEHAAYHRIEAARAARRFPLVLELLADGSITLTNLTLLAPHLTPDNVAVVLGTARHQSKREVECQVAALAPRPDVPASIRRQPMPNAEPPLALAPAAIPEPSPATPACAGRMTAPANLLSEARAGVARDAAPASSAARPSTRQPVVAPLSPDRYKVQITVSGGTVETLRRVQDLMRHTVPDGDPAVIFDRALTLLLEHLERRRLAATARPRRRRAVKARSRHIPAAVRRAVWVRDQGQCTFVGHDGRCGERGFLQFHHLEPHALGGLATVEGIALRCAAHNRYEAELEFGVRQPPQVARELSVTYGAAPGFLQPDRSHINVIDAGGTECRFSAGTDALFSNSPP